MTTRSDADPNKSRDACMSLLFYLYWYRSMDLCHYELAKMNAPLRKTIRSLEH
jgi:hypothetical protein